MKHSIILATAALACATAFAQAPAGVLSRPPQEINPTAAGGVPAAKAEMKTEAKTGAMPMASGMGSTSSMGMGMGMGMKGKNGMVSMADMEAMMKSGGPN